jgi:type IV secretory pathway VirJ component
VQRHCTTATCQGTEPVIHLRQTFRQLLPLLLSALCTAIPARAEPPAVDTLTFGRFGTVHVYRSSPRPHHVVLFASGDGGWNRGVVDMARELAGLDALVAGIDVPAYLRRLAAERTACSYPAADFEGLSQYLQRHYNFPDYVQPVLVGYSSGATLVYTTLAQSPPNTFRGGMSLGFCPELPLSKPLCKGNGLDFTAKPKGKGYDFLPRQDLPTPWIAFQGGIDRVCSADTVARFVAQTGQASMVRLDKVGHGFSVPRNWLPQFRASFHRLVADSGTPAAARPADLEGLPLVEVPVARPGKTFAVIISGDGGWAGIDKSLADTLATRNIPSVGLDSLHYFWNPRTPDGIGSALQDILRHYLRAWHMEKVLLIGYSRGADVLPFMASRLPAELFGHVSLIALLGAEHRVDMEFHVTDWLAGNMQDAPYPVQPEVEKLAHANLLCIYGEDEPAPLCPDLDRRRFKVRRLQGGHHFGGAYQALADLILKEAR